MGTIRTRRRLRPILIAAGAALALLYLISETRPAAEEFLAEDAVQADSESAAQQLSLPKPDFGAYDKKLTEIANNFAAPTGTDSVLWPVKAAYPRAGALLPFNRIVAYYGNLYSKNMGILGEYPEEEMLRRLKAEAAKWEAADPGTPAIPALHYIAVVAQKGAGRDGKYRLRMPEAQINRVLEMAHKANAIVFLDIQAGLSSIEAELPALEKYFKLPNVHLGLDPEFAMKNGAPPGRAIGTLDAKDINFAAEYLARIVRDNNLPPKILVVHRFTRKMLTNCQDIKPLPETQIVINMDGFGAKGNKINTYRQYISKEPVQFTGFKLFYKNDAAQGGLLAPQDLLKLSPIPIYIQYQ